MGKRREPRKPIQVPIRIVGTDSEGKIFSENVTTIDVSQKGARLGGVRARVKQEEIIRATYGENKLNFRVKWVGEPGSPKESQIGVLNLTPEKPFWDFTLPPGAIDNFRFADKDRRQSGRVKCSISAELHLLGQSVIRGNGSDLSLGGCFVEMSSPLPVQTKLEIVLWLGETKLRLKGQVTSFSPGFGIGVRFFSLSSENQESLRRHVESLSKTTRSNLG
jgi:PilZ domain